MLGFARPGKIDQDGLQPIDIAIDRCDRVLQIGVRKNKRPPSFQLALLCSHLFELVEYGNRRHNSEAPGQSAFYAELDRRHPDIAKHPASASPRPTRQP